MRSVTVLGRVYVCHEQYQKAKANQDSSYIKPLSYHSLRIGECNTCNALALTYKKHILAPLTVKRVAAKVNSLKNASVGVNCNLTV